ncbi:hypothetical protein LTR08_004007 [Meristemomyces frigidus]|nr:hypothetical protein LTR08_004007 [Meristemomyces frigidus]
MAAVPSMAAVASSSNQTTDADGKSRLLGLALELFERVAEFLPIGDLSRLRITCTEAAAKTERTFINAHFTDRGVMLCSNRSLQTAVLIARNAKYRNAMRKITFYVDILSTRPKGLEVDSKESQFRRRVPAMTFEKYNAVFRKQHAGMGELGEDIQLLKMLFSLLRYHTADVEVAVQAYHKTQRTDVIRPGTLCLATLRSLESTELSDHRGVRTVMHAMALSGYKPTKLTLGNSPQWSVVIEELSAIVQAGLNTTQVLSNVKSLKLRIWTRPFRAAECELLAISLSRATQLEEITLELEPKVFVLSHGRGGEGRRRGRKAVDGTFADNYQLFKALSNLDGRPLQRLRMMHIICQVVCTRTIVKLISLHESLEVLDLARCNILSKCGDREGQESLGQYVGRVTGFEGLTTDEYTRLEWETIHAESNSDS